MNNNITSILLIAIAGIASCNPISWDTCWGKSRTWKRDNQFRYLHWAFECLQRPKAWKGYNSNDRRH